MQDSDIDIFDPIRMEVLAGARNESHLHRLLSFCMQVEAVPTDYDEAAILYRHCRVNGETVRKLEDCLIAAIAIRNNCSLLHFAALSRHTPLTIIME